MSSARLHLRFGGSRLQDIVPQSVAQQLLQAGSPSLNLEITNIEGHLVPGLSGAPILNQKLRVIAIADGGLENGAVAISWAVPVKLLRELSASTDSLPPARRVPNAPVLFSSEGEARNRGEVTCGALPLTLVRTTSFNQVAASADDPQGLLQLVSYFAVDPSSFNFDVYQHLSSGITVVVPAGAQSRPSASGGCRASLNRGRVAIRIGVELLSSPEAVVQAALAYETSLADGKPLEWRADPTWTYRMPIPRFDGLVVNRKSFQHFTPTAPTAPAYLPFAQDKYLFETLATRRNAFLGASATFSGGTDFLQRGPTCRMNPAGPDCADINALGLDWVKSALAVQLSSFPVG